MAIDFTHHHWFFCVTDLDRAPGSPWLPPFPSTFPAVIMAARCGDYRRGKCPFLRGFWTSSNICSKLYPQYLGDVQLGHLPTPVTASSDGECFKRNLAEKRKSLGAEMQSTAWQTWSSFWKTSLQLSTSCERDDDWAGILYRSHNAGILDQSHNAERHDVF